MSRDIFPQTTADLAATHVTQCPYCIRGHTQAAQRS
jgi:AhpD family alkylhydroperoxidase